MFFFFSLGCAEVECIGICRNLIQQEQVFVSAKTFLFVYFEVNYPHFCFVCSLTNEIAMDCEMVGVSSIGNRSALGRVTLVLLILMSFLCS